MDVEAPQHWCRESVEKLAPWVWSMQGVVMAWYRSAGYDLPEAKQARETMGDWESDWSLRHRLKVLRRATWEATITSTSAESDELRQRIETLKNCVNLAA